MKISEILPANHGGKFWSHALTLVEGCLPCSPGCNNCWLANMEARFGRNAAVYTIPRPRFNGVVFERRDKLKIPKGKPKVYAIWSDLFHEKVSYGFIDDALGAMFRSSHQFIICTKRPAQAVGMLDEAYGRDYPNITIMVTVENQEWANARSHDAARLVDMGWRVGALAEPLLSQIRLPMSVGWSWIITGAETGPHARSCNPDWLRSLRDQAQENNIPFWLKHVNKQDGRTLDGLEWSETP